MQAPPAIFMEHAMYREPEFKILVADRKETLYKLLSVEPDTLEHLVRATGWGLETTQHTLLQLVIDGRVMCKNGAGIRLYHVKTNTS
jgi:predicted Rossmann fold nucleotide-binding protein DprA/Smf involved in DNA uptake